MLSVRSCSKAAQEAAAWSGVSSLVVVLWDVSAASPVSCCGAGTGKYRGVYMSPGRSCLAATHHNPGAAFSVHLGLSPERQQVTMARTVSRSSGGVSAFNCFCFIWAQSVAWGSCSFALRQGNSTVGFALCLVWHVTSLCTSVGNSPCLDDMPQSPKGAGVQAGSTLHALATHLGREGCRVPGRRLDSVQSVCAHCVASVLFFPAANTELPCAEGLPTFPVPPRRTLGWISFSALALMVYGHCCCAYGTSAVFLGACNVPGHIMCLQAHQQILPEFPFMNSTVTQRFYLCSALRVSVHRWPFRWGLLQCRWMFPRLLGFAACHMGPEGIFSPPAAPCAWRRGVFPFLCSIGWGWEPGCASASGGTQPRGSRLEGVSPSTQAQIDIALGEEGILRSWSDCYGLGGVCFPP